MDQLRLYPESAPRYTVEWLPLGDITRHYEAPPEPLVKSIQRWGIMVPIVVEDHGDEGYVAIDGQRRLAAADMLGHEKVPCVVFDEADTSTIAAAMAVIINSRRKPNHHTNYSSVVALYKDGKSENDIAQATGLTTPAVRLYLKLTGLTPKMEEAFLSGRLTFAVAQKVAALAPARQKLLEEGEAKITAKMVSAILPPEEQQLELDGQWRFDAVQQISALAKNAPEELKPLLRSTLKSIQEWQ